MAEPATQPQETAHSNQGSGPHDDVDANPVTTSSAIANVLLGRPTSPLISFLAIPFQALALVLVSWIVHQVVLCINEVYEAAGRRSRSKFASFPWIKISIGVLLLGLYHAGLLRLIIKSYRGNRQGL